MSERRPSLICRVSGSTSMSSGPMLCESGEHPRTAISLIQRRRAGRASNSRAAATTSASICSASSGWSSSMDAKPTKILRSPLSRTFRYASQSSVAPRAGPIRPATTSPAVRLARCHCALSASGRSMPSWSRATRNSSAESRTSSRDCPARTRRAGLSRPRTSASVAISGRSSDGRLPAARARWPPPAGLPQSRAQLRYSSVLRRFVCDTVDVEVRLALCLHRSPSSAADRALLLRRSTHDFADDRTARSDSLLGAVSRSRQALATQIPNRLAERLRVGNLPSG